MATGDATGRMRDAWQSYADQLTHVMALGEDKSPDHVQAAMDMLGVRFMQLFKATYMVISLGEDSERVLQEKT